jgi:hypothetical protein
MICSSVHRFFTSVLMGLGNWTPNQPATQNRGDVDPHKKARKIHRDVAHRQTAQASFILARASAEGIAGVNRHYLMVRTSSDPKERTGRWQETSFRCPMVAPEPSTRLQAQPPASQQAGSDQPKPLHAS